MYRAGIMLKTFLCYFIFILSFITISLLFCYFLSSNTTSISFILQLFEVMLNVRWLWFWNRPLCFWNRFSSYQCLGKDFEKKKKKKVNLGKAFDGLPWDRYWHFWKMFRWSWQEFWWFWQRFRFTNKKINDQFLLTFRHRLWH